MKCPICKKPVRQPDESSNQPSYFPFCSDRCRLIDLGKWLDGAYQIPVDPDDQDEQDYSVPSDPPHT